MLQKIVRILGGDPQGRELKKYIGLVEQINGLEKNCETLSDEALGARTVEFRRRLADGETLDDLLVDAFATVREASKRTIGLRHYDVQLIGGMALHNGRISEMRTGEGKTLVATLPVYLNALTGRGVHLITVNDYLARRDARWMSPIYNLLGLSVGVLQMASRTENGRKAFVVDPAKTSPFEDQDKLRMVDRGEAYKADIVYGTNSEFGFDFLRDNLTMRLVDRVQRGHYFAIVDEVDNILIDEARTPLIISGPASDDTEWYVRMAQAVRALKPEDIEVNERDRNATLTEVGEAHIEEILGIPLRDPERPEDINPEQARLWGYLEQSLKAQYLFRRNKDYIVQSGKVVIVDEFTGRLMPGRRWSEGLHQAVEAKEGVRVEPENVTYATITIQNYFRMYEKLCGMTGTAKTESEEFAKIYKLDVFQIPTNLEYQAMGPEARYIEVTSRDEQGYKYQYYARRDDPQQRPVFFRRKDFPDVVYRSEEAKLRAITTEALRYHILGRPQLIGTTSVEHSERLSDRFSAEAVRRLAQTLLLRDFWLTKNNQQANERSIPELAFLNKPLMELNPGDIRQAARNLTMASINPEDEDNLARLLQLLDLDAGARLRLVKVLQAGIAHQVLNARKHDEESKIIAQAGGFGAVTIATNMAGRGVDIRLGGELADGIRPDVLRVLRRAESDLYNLTDEELYRLLQDVPPDQYSIYSESVQAFQNFMEEMARVRALGGLHVIGSERHEARRIDNQLRGRAARQGDPGSSRFYLSLEDDLMRLFGGQQVENMVSRFNLDENIPIEVGLVGRMVEQSQERVEGSNFDMRKHLLEYDDVLNSQRHRIYGQRDRVFTKPDLSEDVAEMLQEEVKRRVETGLADSEGPWKLLAYLDEIQPPIQYEGISYPTYTHQLLIEEIQRRLTEPGADLLGVLTDIAVEALDADRDHLLNSVRQLLEKLEESYKQQFNERTDILDTFMEGLKDREDGQPVRAQEVLEALSSALRLPIKLNPEQLRALPEGGRPVAAAIRQQIADQLIILTIARAVVSLERRIGGDLGLRPSQFQSMAWDEVADTLFAAVDAALIARRSRLAGPDGQIAHDLAPLIERLGSAASAPINLMALLILMSQGTQQDFDAHTHRRVVRPVVRLTYIFYAARLLGNRAVADVSEAVFKHLQGAESAMTKVWGRAEWNRLRQSEATLAQLDAPLRRLLADALGAERFETLAAEALINFAPADRETVFTVLGTRLQNEIYRELLLRIISNSWVDYLTRIEALRVSITMESYAQRDPLVQYKGQASELFRELLSEIRSGVATAMFTYRPSRGAAATVERANAPDLPAPAAGPIPGTAPTQSKAPVPAGQSKKRKRH
ncbi:MAG TPA: hypothetical protein PKG95_01790 [Anaerolineaceae bacterium]|jgi:preprotein translocase subunit SecA|nr:hypothetical protein [Anaerolineaceae bacterium]